MNVGSATSNREFTRMYRDMGLAICRLLPGQKRPTYEGWNQFTLEPSDFTERDGVGIQDGRLSGDLVTIDLDHVKALQLADKFLPDTPLIGERPGKLKSHRLYRVTDIPPELSARPGVAGDLGGPINQPFNGPDDKRLIDWLGTGLQATELNIFSR